MTVNLYSFNDILPHIVFPVKELKDRKLWKNDMGAELSDMHWNICVNLKLINHKHYLIFACYEFIESLQLLKLISLWK